MKRWMAIIGLLAMVAGPFSAQAELWKKGEPIKIAHRGARAELDENTLEAIKLAVDYGVDMVEFDILRTSDGVLVLMHDETVDRTTDGTGRVDEMTLAEFQQLRTESGFQPPTLAEVLTYFEGNDVNITLDFKIPDEQFAKELTKLVAEHGLNDRAVFESPVPKVAGAIENVSPGLITATYPVKMPFMLFYAKKHDIDVVSYMYIFANPIEVALAHAHGKKVLVWTVNSKGLIKWFKFIGVDGIMTDDPRLFE